MASMHFSMKVDHIWLGYRSLVALYCWNENEFRKHSNTLKISFVRCLINYKAREEVKKCGVRLVYEEDENDRECSFPYATILPLGDKSEDL